MSAFAAIAAGLIVFHIVFHMVILVWWTYDRGYHQGWMDRADGDTNYSGVDAVRSLDGRSYDDTDMTNEDSTQRRRPVFR